MRQATDQIWIIEARLQRFQKDDVRRFGRVKNICERKSVLDFGCGFDKFLSRISTVADTCYGVDLGIDERNFINGKGIMCYKYIEESKGKFLMQMMFYYLYMRMAALLISHIGVLIYSCIQLRA